MALIENTFFTFALLLLYEEDAIQVADIEKVESIIMQKKKALLKNCKDVHESDGSYETHITILYK